MLVTITASTSAEIWLFDLGPSDNAQATTAESQNCSVSGASSTAYWPPGTARPGTYTFSAFGYYVKGGVGDVLGWPCGTGDFTITVEVDGAVAQTFTGTAGQAETVPFDFVLD